jgi:putative FmdB family regulatory protein
VPLYDFTCQACGAEFEELVAAGVTPPCPTCGSREVRRRWSPVGAAGKGLETKGRAARESNARRSDREARRKDAFVSERRRRRAEKG